MLDYLINYGVETKSLEYEDIDVNDRLLLQDQINTARKNYARCLKLLDEIQGKYVECSKELTKRVKQISMDPATSRLNTALQNDDKYIELEAEQTAYKIGIDMVKNQIDYYKNDLRILNSVFYNKF